MKNQKSIFIYDVNEIGAIFILAAIKKMGLEIHPINSMQDLWTWIIDDYSPIFIISDKTYNYFPDLSMFCYLASDKIGGYINPLNIQKNDSNPIIQIILKNLKKKNVLKNNNSVNNIDTWDDNLVASRYGKSLYAAKVFLKNEQKNNRIYGGIINEAITEINDAKQSYNISFYEDSYNRCVSSINEAKEKINKDSSPVRIGNKKIAYAYLDNISLWLDLERLQNDLTVLYPFIVITQYRLNNKEYTWIGSSSVNVNLIFNLKNSNENPYSITLQGSHKQIIKLLSAEAKSLSSKTKPISFR